MNRLTFKNIRTSKGFTLIELAIVGLFLGLLAIFAITQFSGSATDNTKANALYESVTKLTDNWALVSMTCNTPTDITVSPIGNATPTAASNIDVLLGVSAPVTTYQACWNTSGVKALNGLSTGGAGAETIETFPVTATVGATARQILWSFSGVPENIILPLYMKYSSVTGAASATALPTAADTTDAQIRFSTATGGKRTLTLVKTF